MNIEQLFDICKQNGRRPLMVSAGNSAIVAVPGMEGRLFFSFNGELVSLFRREAAEKISTSKTGYFNPGGDGLWPAPEGTKFGYEYASGAWRVPPALIGAQYEVVSRSADSFEIAAEIDLVNNQQLGIPCRFIRKAQIKEVNGAAVIEQYDAIEYIGSCELSPEVFMLAPWSLSQFVVNEKTIARFGAPDGEIRDLYMPSKDLLQSNGDTVTMKHDQANRIQLALPEKSGFVELLLPDRGLQITRTSAPLAEELDYVDIADAAPDADPAGDVRFSIYNDPSGFMELEVVGGCTKGLAPGAVLGVNITNVIKNMENN